MALARVRDQSATTRAALRVVVAGYAAVATGWLLVRGGGSPVMLVGLVLVGALAGAVSQTARHGAVPLAWRTPAVGVGVVVVAMLCASAGWTSLAAATGVVAAIAVVVATITSWSRLQAEA